VDSKDVEEPKNVDLKNVVEEQKDVDCKNVDSKDVHSKIVDCKKTLTGGSSTGRTEDNWYCLMYISLSLAYALILLHHGSKVYSKRCWNRCLNDCLNDDSNDYSKDYMNDT
jgi:hypothetical protein